jgi:hypothetical protein
MGVEEMDATRRDDFLKQLQLVESKRQRHAKKNILPSILHNLHEYLPPQPPSVSTLSKISSAISSRILAALPDRN